MAEHHDVWVMTRADNRDSIEVKLAGRAGPRPTFVYYDFPKWVRRWFRGQHSQWSLHYYPWQVATYFVARRLHRQFAFQIIHHITLMKYWMPTFLVFLPVPLIWGPVGGGESAPRAHYRSLGTVGRAYEFVRDGVRSLGGRDPFVRFAARRCAMAYGTTEESSAKLRELGAKVVRTLPGIGLSQSEIRSLGSRAAGGAGPVRFISIARLLHWKAFHYGLTAFAEADIGDAEYWIVGDGPERRRLEALVSRLGLDGRVLFLGALDRERTLAALGDCHVLVHPSLHDSGGFVCLEAMAAGRPVVCLELGGPAFLVGDDAGIKVPATTPALVIDGLKKAMKLLVDDPGLRADMGEAGRVRMQALSWEHRAREFSAVYEEILSSACAAQRRVGT